jgi:tellurite resistance protein TehA-like permease
MTGHRTYGDMSSEDDWRTQLHRGVEELTPAYFGLVMATGIVSLAAHALALKPIGALLFGLNVPCYVILVMLNAIRVARHPRRVGADFVDHGTGSGFFTFVAASGVLGSQALVIGGSAAVAQMLWGVAVLAWIGLTYTIFTALTVKVDKPSLEQGINGGWLLAVVATQSVAVLSALLAMHADQPLRIEMNFLALSMWLWGGMLYIWMMSLIFYRYAFFRFRPGDLAPPYWINMGAMAISTLAGSLLIANASPDAPYLLSLEPFLKGFTVFYWATATWWIPMLLVLGCWRHAFRRYPLRYDPLYWGLVFPLGMYTAATSRMADVMELGFLRVIPEVFIHVALVTWMCVFVGLLRQIWRHFAPAHGRA